MKDFQWSDRDPFAALDRPVEARVAEIACGTPVRYDDSFAARLASRHPPAPGSLGVVVRLREPAPEGYAWVRFAGVRAPSLVYAGALTETGKPKPSMSRRIASRMDLTGFMRTASGDLVHAAEDDLWNLRKCDDGSYIIERLFDADGNPLKETP